MLQAVTELTFGSLCAQGALMLDRRSKHRPSCLCFRGKSNLEKAPIPAFFFFHGEINSFFLSQASDGRNSRWNSPQLPRNLHSYLA